MFKFFEKKRKSIEAKKLIHGDSNTFSNDLETNSQYIKSVFSNCIDLKSRNIRIGHNEELKGYIFYIDGMVDTLMITENIIKPLINLDFNKRDKDSALPLVIYNEIPTADSISLTENPDDFINKLLSGSIGIILEGEKLAVLIEVAGWEERTVEESQSETVVKGASGRVCREYQG
jgi:hypothetical protein